MRTEDHRVPLFPIFLKLDGCRCLVVGAGPVGESKIASLLEAGADVRVVSPDATRTVRDWAGEGRLVWVRRRFEPDDLRDEGGRDVRLVIAALPAGEDLARIADEARRRGVLCNAVDVPDHCDFYYPAVVRRGDLQIAISTSGHSPALAQRLRRELEAQFGHEYGQWLEDLGQARRALFAAGVEAAERTRLLHELASGEAFARYRASRVPDPDIPALGSGKVFLVGAGPGDPELLTLRALRVIGMADVVFHDDLVPAEVLELVPPGAQVRSVGKRHGTHHISQEGINALLIEGARAGRVVVRLKGGDVSIFGRANEEMQALSQAGVAFEVVPGVTAVSGAAAAAGVSLTDRATSSAVVLVTAQVCRGHARPDWGALVASGATLAIYMPGQRYDRIAGDLLRARLPPETPCLVVSRASQPDEMVRRTSVRDIASGVPGPAPAILIVGEVVGRRPAAGVGGPSGSRETDPGA